jgi:iron complex outermembrane receptor protein
MKKLSSPHARVGRITGIVMAYRFKARLLTSTLLLGVATLAAPALAQTGPVESVDQTDQSAADTAGEDEGDIVVTGSRIPRPEVSASVPVAVLSDEGIQATGAANLQDALAELPSVGQNISRSSTNFSTTANGQASVNLRNLGSARTLVLVDGRRFVAGLPGTSIVDLNSLPTDLIERIEVVTGGASAVYGSEAIAGVVNFVLRRRASIRLGDRGPVVRRRPRQHHRLRPI